MSRLGKLPVQLPGGVQAQVAGNVVTVSGPKGKLTLALGQGVTAKVDGKAIVVNRGGNSTQDKANHGSARSHLQNMVEGVTKGWQKSLELHGVGYNAALSGQVLTLNVGFSHEVKMTLPPVIKCKIQKTTIELESVDREVLGRIAAEIRKVRPPEPYLGKGIRITGQYVRRKAGKAGKK